MKWLLLFQLYQAVTYVTSFVDDGPGDVEYYDDHDDDNYKDSFDDDNYKYQANGDDYNHHNDDDTDHNFDDDLGQNDGDHYYGDYFDDYHDGDFRGTDITGVPEVDKAIMYLADCSGTYFNFDSCMAQTSFQLLSEGEMFGGLIMGCANGTLPCASLNFTEEVLFMISDEIIMECYNETDDNELDDFIGNITSLFDSGKCWEDLLDIDGGFETVTGSIKGDLALGYVGQCVGVEINMESCVFHRTLDMIFSMPEPLTQDSTSYRSRLMHMVNNEKTKNIEGENDCMAPKFSEDELVYFTKQGESECNMNGQNTTFIEVTETMNVLGKIFGNEADKCWLDICSGEAQLSMMMTWLEICADIDLPLPVPKEIQEVKDPMSFESQQMLACMVEYAMTEGRVTLGDEDASLDTFNTCMPPRYPDHDLFCPSQMGPIAFEKCRGKMQSPNMTIPMPNMTQPWPIPNMTQPMPLPNMTVPMPNKTTMFDDPVYTATFVYNESDSSSHGGNFDDIVDTKHSIIDNFCRVMKSLTSEKAKSCLLPVCMLGNDEFDSPETTGPVPSLVPTKASTSKPSPSPSLRPSSSSTIANVPSSFPSSSPSYVPSIAPSSVPSMAPSSSSSFVDWKKSVIISIIGIIVTSTYLS